jgi:hypothetical protein
MSKEYRKNKRVKPNIKIQVYDVIIGRSLGEVMNVSSDGILIACEKITEVGEMFQTDWTFDARGLKSISVGLECLWSENNYSSFCLSGFHIIDISEDDQDIIDRIISQSKEVD